MSKAKDVIQADEAKLEPIPLCQLYWDYYGPSAKGTAGHFLSHLQEWLEKNHLLALAQDIQLISLSEFHWAASCVLPLKEGELVYRSLRAHRAISYPKTDLQKTDCPN